MADAIAYRGPDDGGAWTDGAVGIALGHRRLSILDCSPSGHQPMVSSDGRFVIAYNGEIYNHIELARALDEAGVTRRGHSDTEVILEAFARWGVAAILPRLAGMFALALWDRAERRLTLVRDPLGIKPLYWGMAGDGTFLFGSELKALRAHPSWDFAIDDQSVAAFFRFGYVPAPASIFRGVQKLPAGCVLSLETGREPRIEAFWRLDEVARAGQAAPLAVSDAEATDALEDLLASVTAQHLMADVPVGAFLSGGIDSSAVVAMMAKAGPVRTFTIGYEDRVFDESAAAAAVAAHLGTDHTVLTVEAAQVRSVIPRLPEMYDEPFADSSAIPTFLLSELTRRHVTVALSGDGGDELFAGYNRHVYGERVQTAATRLPGVLRRGVAAAASALSPDAWDTLLGRLPLAPRLIGNKMHKLAASLKTDDVPALYRSLVSFWPDGVTGRRPGSLGEAAVPAGLDGLVETFQYLDAVTYLPDDVLVKVDRASMAVGLESRVPLLDRRVAEFAWRLPRHLRLRDGRGKWLLRQVLYRHVPKTLVERPKMGFAVPVGAWLRGPLRDWAEDLLAEETLRATGLIDPVPIRRRWAEHLAGRGNHDHHLWIALMFAAWTRRWV